MNRFEQREAINKILTGCGQPQNFDLAEQLLTELEMAAFEHPSELMMEHFHAVRVVFNDLCTMHGQGMTVGSEEYQKQLFRLEFLLKQAIF